MNTGSLLSTLNIKSMNTSKQTNQQSRESQDKVFYCASIVNEPTQDGDADRTDTTARLCGYSQQTHFIHGSKETTELPLINYKE